MAIADRGERVAAKATLGLPGQITIMSSSLYWLMAARIGREYAKAQAKTIYRDLLDVSATVQIGDAEVIVTVDKRAHNPCLVASGLADYPTPMPWFGDELLKIRST